MIVIIPMGGLGTRFRDNGYNYPKPLVKVCGKEIIYWLIDNLKVGETDTLVIPYDIKLNSFNFRDRLHLRYPNIKFTFIELKEQTRGAAETVNIAINSQQLKDKVTNLYNEPVLLLDGDTFHREDIIGKAKDFIEKENTNGIFYFTDVSPNPIYSYISTNSTGEVISIKEKEKISDYACVGAYLFRNALGLMLNTEAILRHNEYKTKGEYYTSDVYRRMLAETDETIKAIEITNFSCLGTPDLVKLFSNSIEFEQKRFCFDIDNTLLTVPEVKGDYTTCKPIEKNISILRNLYLQGHYIILHTARRMKTHNGDVQKVIAEVGELTKDSLKKFGIPYHELHFGKPYAHYYIDDLAIDAFNDLEKELGYYNLKIDTRSFNNLTIEDKKVIKTSTSKDFEGELYYYQHIPEQLREYFPNAEVKEKTLIMENVQGLTLSQLYINGLLKESDIAEVFKALRTIHSIPNQDKINIYSNYTDKLKKRYNEYEGYNKFDGSEVVYKDLIAELNIYEDRKLGKQCTIHGDPVLTNIIKTPDGKLKFIDMRGKVGKELTIGGDMLYDYAKLYQSLIGYDFVLNSRSINSMVISNFSKAFEREFLNGNTREELENVKTITKSLLFSLIPLHDNEKCYGYYNLIKGI